MADISSRKEIVIIGGGIIGSTTAYFLTRHPAFLANTSAFRITLLEASKIAGGASGKAGGLLALWAYPSNLVPLSFRLHKKLAEEHGGDKRWGYRSVGCGQIEARARPVRTTDVLMNGTSTSSEDKEAVSLQKRSAAALKKLKAAGVPKDLDWVDSGAVDAYDDMAGPGQTAQVHPYQFTTSMAQLAEESGAQIVTAARVTSIDSSSESGSLTVTSVTYTDTGSGQSKSIPASVVVLAAGPWTQRLLPSAPISGLRAHSVTIRPTRELSPYALFTHINLPSNFRSDESKRPRFGFGGETVTPEIYARPNNEIYACGEGDRLVPLPETTGDVETDGSRCQDIIDYVGSISDELRDGEVAVRQACYLPVCESGGGPYIGEVPDVKGLIIASGHSCWGIQNAPATGKIVSEIVMDGKAQSAKLGQLDPSQGML